jgi:hypothetical protein
MAALVDSLCAPSVVVDNAAALVYDTFNAASAAGFFFDNAAGFYDGAAGIVGPPAPAPQEAPAGEASSAAPPRRKRRRRARSCKSREEAECQRMTHIAVERNRRRQMNEYLVQLRSLMPESYVQRVRAYVSLVLVFVLIRHQRRRKGCRSKLRRMMEECFLGPKETHRHYCRALFSPCPVPSFVQEKHPFLVALRDAINVSPSQLINSLSSSSCRCC